MASSVLGGSVNTIGELIDLAIEVYKRFGWHKTAAMFRSDDAAPNIDKLPHPAAPLLHRIAKNGAPVVISTEPWSKETLDARAERGSHTSADDHKEFLVEEYLDFGRKGFWVLLPYELVKDEPGLRLSPLGVVPQDGRRPRLISDYSFWGLNEETQKLAPEGAMQFGTAPRRIAEDIMRSNPKFGPVYVMKNDMSDGFYRIRLTSSGSLKLAVILPKNLVPGYPQLVALPLVLPMGWTESPPLFCAYTETVADLTNIDLRRNKRFVPHPSAELAEAKDFLVEDQHETRSIPLSHENRLYKQPIHKVEVFVDDFIGIGQDHPQNPLSNQRAALSHNIDKIFRPNRPSDSQYRKEPQSQSKMEKGDASWHTMKEALGWNWGGKSKTLQLKPKRAMKAIALVNEVINSKRVALKTWQQVIGVLRSLQPGLTGSEGQFSLLQEALTEAQRRPRDHRVRVTGERKQQLELLLDYLQSHEKRPALLEELVPGEDVHVGTVDAAKAGRGGVWFTEDGRAIVWRAPYSPEVQAQVISESNPTGTLTNSDLELEGTVLHHWLLGKVAPVAGETTYTGCDNTPTVSWRTKGSSTSRAARARLLRLVAGLRRKQRAHHRIGHLAGELNGMGDDASRLWDLSDAELLTHYSLKYPQITSWELYLVPDELNCLMTSVLLDTTSSMESALHELQRHEPLGPLGATTAEPSMSHRNSQKSMIPCSSSFSTESSTGKGKLPRTRFELEQLKTPCARWARRFPYWGS